MDKKESVFILAPFPQGEDLRDGMMQRIAAMDELMYQKKKVYVNISIKNKRFVKIVHNENIIEYFLNPLNPFLIFKYFIGVAYYIYSHSIHPFKFIPYFFLFSKSKHIILDAHGVVPEEIKMYGKFWRYKYALLIEKFVFNTLTHCVCVTNAMILHFKRRYVNSPAQYHLYSTSELMVKPLKSNVDELRLKLGYSVSETVILYSGNTQTWQNIPLMLDLIKDLKSHKILILTGEVERFKKSFADKQIALNNIIILSVSPQELNNYYSLCNYGFILREDSLINNVANPTKMLEYLQFGLIPIVLSPKIGDYYLMNYEYIEIGDLKKNDLKPAKSSANMKIAEVIGRQNKKLDINRLFV